LVAFSYVFLDDENLKIISFVGGISIIGFASTQIFNVTKGKVDHKLAYGGVSNKKAPILLGAMFSALNPLFLIWWFTIGLKLISDSIHFFGLVNGILILFSSHIWMDYAWLIITSDIQRHLGIKDQILFFITYFNKYSSCFLWCLYHSKDILITWQIDILLDRLSETVSRI
jgi:threonine/homoserine/homoserine lactone efflux protein